MASSKIFGSLAMLLALLAIPAKGDIVPPILSPYFENICNEVNCGKGSCQNSTEFPGFTCQCDNGWKRTRTDDEQNLEFLPCVIPNCTLDYSCMPAAPPAPPVPYNLSIFDPCYWIYCGGGTCSKNLTYTHTCQCNPGYSNLENITAFPCFSECAIGSDCSKLGIKVSNSNSDSSSSPNGASQATSFLPGKLHWITTLLMSVVMALWN